MAPKLPFNSQPRDVDVAENNSPGHRDASSPRTHGEDSAPDLAAPTDSLANGSTPPIYHPSDNNDLPLPVQDTIFQQQMTQAQPLSITPQTIIAAGVCGWEKDANKVHQALVKAGVLESTSPKPHMHAPSQGLFHLSNSNKTTDAAANYETEEFIPVTNKITSALPKQLRVLGIPATKLLIKLLFYWEEEINRWRARELDIAELEKAQAAYIEKRKALAQEDNAAGRDSEETIEEQARLEQMAKEIEFRIQAIRLRRRVKPSDRTLEPQLPEYERR